MYTPEYFNDKRVIVGNDALSPQLNGKRVILSKAYVNGENHIIACTNIPDRRYRNAFFWVDVTTEVTHELEYDGYSYQYRHKKTNETLMLPFDIDVDRKDEYDLIGNFDQYKKIPVVFDLFTAPELIPNEVNDILERYDQENGLDYIQLANMLEEVNRVGYTFDYGLDADPYNLRKL